MGYVYYKLNNYKKSIECLENALQIDPHDFNLWDQMGDLYMQIGNQEKAKKCHKKGIASFYKDLTTHFFGSKTDSDKSPKN